MSRASNWALKRQRFGLLQTLRATTLNFIRRFVAFELCRFCTSSGKPYRFTVNDPNAVTAIDDCLTFKHMLHHELMTSNYDWAFERGDQCVANVRNGVIVGFGFSTQMPTRVTDRVEIFFPQWCRYSYASFTAPSYRGQKLARDRWPAGRALSTAKLGFEPREVYYHNVANSETLKSDVADGTASIRLGYGLWAHIGSYTVCWNSPAAKRNGIGFRSSRTVTTAQT